MSAEAPQLISKSRLVALSDGVVAVVLTILVLQLGGAAISNAETGTQLEAALFAQWPTFVSYAISFLVVGVYWVAHHTYFTFVQDVDGTLLWLNLLFLFCLSFIPFASELIGDHPGFRAGAVLYGLNLTACTGALSLNWRYAWNQGHVLVPDTDLLVMERFRGATRYAAVAYLVATGVAWFSPIIGFYLYIAIAVLYAFRQIRRKTMERVLRRT